MTNNRVFTGERVIEGCVPKKIWKEHLQRYQFTARMVPKARVLDIACGTGYGCVMFAECGAEYVLGVDIDRSAVEFAKKIYASRGNKGLAFMQGDLCNLGLSNRSFDLVTSFETLEHVSRELQPQAVSELARVTAVGGRVIISTPNRDCVARLREVFRVSPNPFHKCELGLSELYALLSRHFRRIEVLSQGGIPKILFHVFPRGLRRRCIRLYQRMASEFGIKRWSSAQWVVMEPTYFVCVCYVI